MITNIFLLHVLLLVCVSVGITLGYYTEESPVKLLSVQSIADRYEASASEYRTSVEHCHVSFAKRYLHRLKIRYEYFF